MLSLVNSSPHMKSVLALNLALILILAPAVQASYSATPAEFVNQGARAGLTLKTLSTAPAATNDGRMKNALNKLPISFEPNRGQVDRKVKFLSRGNGYSLMLSSNEALLSLSRPIKATKERTTAASGERSDRSGDGSKAVIRMKLAGANSNPRIEGLDELPGKVNYFKGKDPAKWQTGVANYSRVRYQQVYPGIDLVYHGRGQQLEYDFVVAPGADPKKIRMEFKGTHKLEINNRGDLILHTPLGEVSHNKPFIYQDVNGTRQRVVGRFVKQGQQVGFEVGTYDATKPLVIDPVISYSTLLGGSGGGASSFGSSANGIAIHTAADGNVYVYLVGTTNETDFPIRNAAQAAFGGTGPANWLGDVFVVKFNMAASGDASLIYSTYLGGMGNENGTSIAVDSEGNAYIAGFSGSTNFPLQKAAQSSSGGGGDAFVTALNPDGTDLIYSTHLGGSQSDAITSIAVDSTGNAYVTGQTNSANFPVVNAYQSTPQGSNTSFVSKIAPPVGSGSASLVYSTYLGGSSVFINGYGYFHSERGNGIAVDAAGNAYVTGVTGSSSFPILNGFQTVLRCSQGNVFVAKLNPAASGAASLLYSTYLGGSCPDTSGDTGAGIAVDSAGDAYVTGVTSSYDFPTTPGAFMPNRRTSNTGFTAKIDPSQNGASSLIYSTLIGGTAFNGSEGCSSIAVDAEGNVYVTGHTISFDFPLVNATQSFNNGVLQSINGGGDWKSISNGIATPVIKALAVDTSTSPRTLYAGGRDILHADQSVYVNGGVYKSIDGGLNWSPINSGLTNTDIRDLVISPTNPSRLYAATRTGVFKTDDGGVSWSAFNIGLNTAALTSLSELAFDSRTSPATLYAGAGDNLYKISDAGSNWSVTAFKMGVHYITVDSSTSPGTLYIEGNDYHAYKSSDGGVTWTDIQTDTGGYEMAGPIGVDPSTTPSTLYRSDFYGANFVKSVNGGNSWQLLGRENLLDGAGDPFGRFTVDTTTTPSTLYIDHGLYGDFGGGAGLWRSTDGGNTWTRILGRVSGAFALDATTATATTPSTLYFSTGFPSPDAFVAKLNSTGSALLFSTYLGGYGTDHGQGIALDPSGNIYIAGRTQEGPFPTVNAYQATSRASSYPNIDAFVVKLGSAALVSSSTERVTTELGIQTGTLELSFPNITGSTSGTAPTATVNALDSTTTANLTLSNNLGAYEIKTTATYDTSGYASDPTNGIKIAFSVPTVNDLAVFNNLVISHGEDSNADGIIQPSEMIPYNGTVDPNKVTHHDFATRTVWVYVPSLSPFVIVKGAADQFSDLVRLIKSFNLKAGIENSLDKKLQNALKAYQAALAKDRAAACNQMGAFISEAQAQTGKALTEVQANQLIAAARQIKVVLGCR